MVELEGHTTVHGTVHLEINILPDLVGAEVCRQRNVPSFPEASLEEITGSRTQTVPLHDDTTC
jgi:hypothetical protein